jgi:hypothetical protein
LCFNRGMIQPINAQLGSQKLKTRKACGRAGF